MFVGGGRYDELMPSATCPECFRRFDLTDEVDAEEWSYGHDCEGPAGVPSDALMIHCLSNGVTVTVEFHTDSDDGSRWVASNGWSLDYEPVDTPDYRRWAWRVIGPDGFFHDEVNSFQGFLDMMARMG